ncbi:MAG: type II toxin-antitoxin system HicA family toxin [Verrucomicrobia bacterium]|nr:type II toxin-antitoxin system HicA family toxin [Verrucomicrobiota bacterium]MDA0723297.1 type II toxin-antitoxin system HicA family toxin [Verrucomicrobiota bacterium]MDA1046468.1 type II toxin-antitoxin system HicA family toxin [Verrucomicrobiota bacterium]
MKRKELLRYLSSQSCELLREGSRHSIWWRPDNRSKSAVPRHNEVRDLLVKRICKDLEVPPPTKT